ncbi:BTB domain-containing protein [Mycena venus]|uniref:BTB domain-containing protein n=1 Tax=Mycena venus TaxID=2733690 RepID=A0A8H6XGY6_9AGAR|nr:BTB domain-containing protein [Mycena venus]
MAEGNIQKIDGLWFSNDSLVVLRAQERVFRVPKSILAARSPVFQSMFEFPQPVSGDDAMAGADEVMDGSPVIRLHDSPTEVEAFLRAIFDSNYFMPPPSQTSFSDLLGILRLAQKYDVGYLYKRAVCHLETIYPIELAKVEAGTSTVTLYVINATVDFDLEAIAVLHEVGATWLLPYAYYSAAENPVSDLLYAGELWEQCPTNRKEILLCLQPCQREATDRLFDALTSISKCLYADACNMSKFKFLKRRARHQRPLSGQYTFCRRLTLEAELCETCSTQAREQYETRRAEIWDALPINCGMENWEVLLQQREAAMA